MAYVSITISDNEDGSINIKTESDNGQSNEPATPAQLMALATLKYMKSLADDENPESAEESEEA